MPPACYRKRLVLQEEWMSERNGEKSRFQINRKRAVLRRAKIRAMVAAGATSEKRPAHGKPKPKA
jgi:hypothetical protein